MTRNLPEVFKKFRNVVTDVKLVIELFRTQINTSIKKTSMRRYPFLESAISFYVIS